MKVQVLVAAMNQKDHSLLEKMNIQTDAIIANQCDYNSVEEFDYKGNKIKYLNFAERGVGLNRNNALLRADGDVIVIADEDVVYVDGYEEIVKKAFNDIPDADAVIFNINVEGRGGDRRQNQEIKRIRFHNALNYGAVRTAVKTKSAKRENINFHTCFGGGTKYSCGEDTLFIVDMLKAGLKIYAYPVAISTAYQLSSTWFNGYNKKYLHDKGALFSALSKKWCFLLCLQDLIRHPRIYKEAKVSFFEALKLMRQGKNNFKKLVTYNENEKK